MSHINANDLVAENLAASEMNCKCSLAISLCGDGCRYCQPQSYIDRLVDQYEENETEYKAALIKAREALEYYARDDDGITAREALTAINEVLS